MKKIIQITHNFIHHNKAIGWTLWSTLNFILIYIIFRDVFHIKHPLTSLIFDLSVATVAAIIFYILQVYIPNKKKKKEIKFYINAAIISVRYKIVLSLIRMMGKENEQDLHGKLAGNHARFTEYFSEDELTMSKWYNLMEKFYEPENQQHLEDILGDLEVFYDDIQQFIMTVPDVQDEYAYREISGLRHMIIPPLRLKRNSSIELGQILWLLLAGNSIYTVGRPDFNPNDFIIENIQKI